jgi:hypothetical protein
VQQVKAQRLAVERRQTGKRLIQGHPGEDLLVLLRGAPVRQRLHPCRCPFVVQASSRER